MIFRLNTNSSDIHKKKVFKDDRTKQIHADITPS